MRSLVLFAAVAAVLIGVMILMDEEPAAVELANVYDQSPTAFTFRYPADWFYQIPGRNLLVTASREIFSGLPGPSFLLERDELLLVTGSAEAALATYLERGPLRPNRNWTLVQDMESIDVNGRPAVRVLLEGSEFADYPNQQRLQITATQADNRVVYFLVMSAPLDTWDQHEPTFAAILDSLEIVEQ